MVNTLKKRRRVNVPEYITNALQFLRPPENLTVSEWAEKYRILDNKSSALPGKWSNDVTPYLRGIMDEFNNPYTEEIAFIKPTQVGGTEALQNMLGYIVMQDQSPAMIVYPTDKLAESVSVNRLQPMLKTSPELSKSFLEFASSKSELQFDGMYVTLSGANSPSSLASKPVRFLLLDEVDKFPGSSQKEANPVKLARERTKTFTFNKKIFMASTPTLKTNHIWKAREKADVVYHYFVLCPHCKKLIELKFDQVRWSDNKELGNTDRAATAHYICQECGERINDNDKRDMLINGQWRSVIEKTKYPKKVAYWINTIYSPFVRFSHVAEEFLDCKDNPEELQNFVNSWLAEPWEDTKVKTNAETVLKRQTEFEEFVVPDWAEFLTAGGDVQQNYLYYTIRAWGMYQTSQNITHGQALSFSEIENIMNLEYVKEDGTRMIIALCGIDSGDQTNMVYDFCANNTDWAIPVKGASHSQTGNYKISTINKAESRADGMRLVLVEGNKYKDAIAMRLQKEGQGSWQVYKGCDMEYANQVTAEHKINEKKGGQVRQVWVPKTSHADNHYLDCEVYAYVAADILGVRALHLTMHEKEDVAEVKVEAQEKNNNQNSNDWLNGNSWL